MMMGEELYSYIKFLIQKEFTKMYYPFNKYEQWTVEKIQNIYYITVNIIDVIVT